MLLCAVALPAEAPLVPFTVCEVLRDLPAHEDKDLAIIGRYSFRSTGRSMSEQSCDPALEITPQLPLVEEKDAPKPPENLELDGNALRRKFADMQKRTSLGKFRFGTPDYDRWAVVYGRVTARKGDDAKKTPAEVIFRGSGVVIFLTPEP
ncbi:MAG TPA: hypothetical protein VGF59_31825 [Bryobacteraceae bacterium]